MRKLLTLGLAALLLAIPFAASAQDAFTTRSVNVRAGPDTSYPAVATLGGGAPVEIMGCLDDWSWCDVVFGPNRGWVYAPNLSYVYQGARVPFYTYAPSFGIPIIAFSLGSYWDRYYRGRSWYGRRDYWERREPRHIRPAGPPPRATAPTLRERTNNQDRRQSSVAPAVTGNRGTQPSRDYRPPRDGNVPSADRRVSKGTPSGSPPAQVNRPAQETRRAGPAPQGGQPQEMRRASPTQQAAPPPAVREGSPRGGEKGRAPEGEKGHEGAKP
jgi:uncharacterized protein YraI